MMLTPATAATVGGHLLQLGRHDLLSLSEDVDQLTSRLGVLGREVGVRRALGSSTLRPVSATHMNSVSN